MIVFRRCSAQRRPGREPRRHTRPACCRCASRALNEGRGANPGDTRTFHPAPGCASTLNEGRGANPGDTGRAPGAGRDSRRRSTKAGARTPATPLNGARAAMIPPPRSTKAGARTPATPTPRTGSRGRSRPLNEGRGANPGDTRHGPVEGRQPHVRSTKAGARTPATPAEEFRRLDDGVLAQRRPGREPRRHLPTLGPAHPLTALNEGRGANPGDTAGRKGLSPAGLHAQRRPGREPRRHIQKSPPVELRPPTLNEGRGANPGDTPGASVTLSTPACAQRRPGREPRRHSTGPGYPPSRCSLNEGRGANPGDTRGAARALEIARERSTKAGARTPATPARMVRERQRAERPLNEGRGANPGDTGGGAQKRAGPLPRSTKAGARTPATR